MTLQTIYDAFRRASGTTVNSYPDAQCLVIANLAKTQIYQQIVDIREDFFGQISTATLVNNQDEYILPNDFYKLIRVELNYTNTSGATLTTDTDWVMASEWDESQRGQVAPITVTGLPGDVAGGSATWEWLRENQPTSAPLFNIYDQSVFIAPSFNLPASAIQNNGLKIWYIPFYPDYVASSDNVIYPFTVCVKAFAQFMAAEYFDSTGQTDRRDTAQEKYEVEMAKIKRLLTQVDISPVITEIPNDDGSNY